MASSSCAALPLVVETPRSQSSSTAESTKVRGWGLVAFRELGYDIEKTLGTSGGLVIARAKNMDDGQPVMLRYATTSTGKKDEQVFRQFQEENTILSSMKHPSIIRLIKFFETDFEIGTCLEWCDTGSINEHVQINGPSPEAQAAWILKQLFAGVAYLHGSGVIHNALSPAALLLHSEGKVLKISDFSRASCRALFQELVVPPWLLDMQCKDDPYVAPELKLGEASSWDARADIWSAGLCSIHLLFGASQVPAIASAATNGNLDAEDWSKLSVQMQNFLTQCLMPQSFERSWAQDLVRHSVLISEAVDEPQMVATVP